MTGATPPLSSAPEAGLAQAAVQPAGPSYRSYGRLLRDNRNFRLLWLAQIISEMGDWFYCIAIYSLLLEFTGRAQSVGLALVVQVLPQALMNPTAGVVNDRVRRKHVMIFADLARAGIVASMLLVRSRETVWLVYPLLLMETLMWAFFEPGRSAVIPNIVKRNEVVVANTLSSTTWSFNYAVGSALGGLTTVLLGRRAVFLLNAASFLVSAFLIRRMRFDEPHAANAPPLRAGELFDVSPIMEGVRYVRRDPRLLTTVFVKAGVGLVGTGWVLYTVMGERLFPVATRTLSLQGGAVLGMSLLMGARGFGALLGPLIAAPWAEHDTQLRRGILLGFVISMSGWVGLAVAPNMPLACMAILVTSAGSSVAWVFSTTILQMYTEDKYRGRVFSADLGFAMLTLSMVAYLTGLATDLGVPLRLLALFSGALLLIPAGAWAWAQKFWKAA